jgi:hypothetical protein
MHIILLILAFDQRVKLFLAQLGRHKIRRDLLNNARLTCTVAVPPFPNQRRQVAQRLRIQMARVTIEWYMLICERSEAGIDFHSVVGKISSDGRL